MYTARVVGSFLWWTTNSSTTNTPIPVPKTQSILRVMMGKRDIPQALAIPSVDDLAKDELDQPPLSGLSLKSPKGPRSPFRFSSKLQFGTNQSIQAHQDQPTSPTIESPFANRVQTSTSGTQQEKFATSPAKGGFFSNYKASKSASRLQPTGQLDGGSGDDDGRKMSRDLNRPAISSRVSGTDKGKTTLVSFQAITLLTCHSRGYC